MQRRTVNFRGAGIHGVQFALSLLAIATLNSPSHTAEAQEIADTYVLSSQAKGETRFQVLANRIGVVPADGVEVDAVREAVENAGFGVISTQALEPILIAATIGDAGSYADLQGQAQELKAATEGRVRWAGPVVVTGEVEAELSIERRDLLIPTNVLMVKALEETGIDRVLELSEGLGLRLLQRNPVNPLKFYFQHPAELIQSNVFTDAQALMESGLVAHAIPNMLFYTEQRQAVVDDPLLHHQWPLDNTGQELGVVDADIDADLAWKHFTLGSEKVVIAILDDGFDMGHPDLAPNFYQNEKDPPGDTDGDGDPDDDDNGFVDDERGWDFTSQCWGQDNQATLGCGDNNPNGSGFPGGIHGTMTAGAAAARGDNAIGVSGSCPRCTLLPLKVRTDTTIPSIAEQEMALTFAILAGADIISLSWGYSIDTLVTDPVESAIQDATDAGIVVFVAMSSTGTGAYTNDCVDPKDLSSLENVIAVSASNNSDTRTPAGFGDCLSVLAPTDNEAAGVGTLWPASTDMRGSKGINPHNIPSGCISGDLEPPVPDHLDFTRCANGTSYAAPLTAGVAGLLLSLDDTLTPDQIRHILQDTADKIDPAVANYDPNTGLSASVLPTPIRHGTPDKPGRVYGYGRVNAYEAVKLVAPLAAGGRQGVDLVAGFDEYNWGNTEQPSDLVLNSARGFRPDYRSTSIKIDAPPFESGGAPTDAESFAAFADEEPKAGETNRVYLLVRNRGWRDASDITALLAAGRPFDRPPSEVWITDAQVDSAGANSWSLVDRETIARIGYSGASVAMHDGDGAAVVAFDFTAPALDPDEDEAGDFALLAIVTSPQDCLTVHSTEGCITIQRPRGLMAHQISSRFNNVTLRHVELQGTSD